MNGKIINCRTKDQIKKAMKEGKIAKISWCSLDKKAMKCAEYIEKEINAEVKGILANKKENQQENVLFAINQRGKSYTLLRVIEFVFSDFP
ncbi:unnamed protein product [marine sediment metagenome]|uniref:Uncharacterized protein n=1 Tax=marine sediment metagenome TaxID=412755 RepID=X1FI64_9ZZZZ